MTIEHWGSLSVSDHNDIASLTANVLLYDRLVLPIMDRNAEDQHAHWEERGWSPELQRKRLDQLEELAICRPWNEERQKQFATRLAEIRAEQFDAGHIDQYGLTRMILAQEQVSEKFAGVDHVQVIPAYNSNVALRKDFTLEGNRGHVETQAMLLSRRLAVPESKDPEKTLLLARNLSRKPEFREKRTALFDFMSQLATQAIPPEVAVARIAELTDGYNDAVRAATRTVQWRFAFSILAIGVGFATAGVAGVVGAAATAALSVVQFATLDRKPVIEAGRAAPVAMFHDLKTQVGVTLKR